MANWVWEKNDYFAFNFWDNDEYGDVNDSWDEELTDFEINFGEVVKVGGVVNRLHLKSQISSFVTVFFLLFPEKIFLFCSNVSRYCRNYRSTKKASKLKVLSKDLNLKSQMSNLLRLFYSLDLVFLFCAIFSRYCQIFQNESEKMSEDLIFTSTGMAAGLSRMCDQSTPWNVFIIKCI